MKNYPQYLNIQILENGARLVKNYTQYLNIQILEKRARVLKKLKLNI
jgi:hypothetical protein